MGTDAKITVTYVDNHATLDNWFDGFRAKCQQPITINFSKGDTSSIDNVIKKLEKLQTTPIGGVGAGVGNLTGGLIQQLQQAQAAIDKLASSFDGKKGLGNLKSQMSAYGKEIGVILDNR